MGKSDPTLRRIIFFISDGEDNTSHHHLEDAIRTAQENNVVIFTLNIQTQINDHDSGKGKKTLNELARTTGGLMFVPKTELDINEAYKLIATIMQGQYLVVLPTDPQKGKHSIKIVSARKDVIITGPDAIYARPTSAVLVDVKIF